jgi:hypothetical protein
MVVSNICFCSLPLHAMSPIPSDDGAKLYSSDLYISSYTPRLSAFIESSRRCATQTLDKPRILLVVQPDQRQLEAREEMLVVEALKREYSQLTAPKRQPLLP